MYKRGLIAFVCIAAIALLQIPTVALANEGFTPFDYTKIAKPTVDGITITMPAEPTTDRTITMAFDMTQERWKNAFTSFTYDAYISIPFVLELPNEAEQVYYTGTSGKTEDQDAMLYLKSGEYGSPNSNKTVEVWVDIAHVAYDGTTAIITPISAPHSFCMKWKDNEDKEHFHRLDFAATQQSTEACKIFAAVPDESRIVLQQGVNGSYSDGVVTYSGGMPNSNIETFIKSPVGANQLMLNGTNVNTLVTFGSDYGTWLGTPVSDILTTHTFNLQWKNAENNVVKAECLTITIVPTAQGEWLKKVGNPVPKSRMCLADGAQKDTVTKHLTYDENKGEWRFKANAGYDFDPVALCGGEWIFRITPPAGAVSVRIASGTGPRYGAGFEQSIENQFSNTNCESIPITDPGSYSTNSEKLKFTLDGDILSKAALEGSDIYVYTVNKTMSGYGSWMVFRWLNEDNASIMTEFVYLIKEAFVREFKSEVLTSEPADLVNEPTAVYEDGDCWLKTQTPLQKKTGKDAWLYQLNDIQLVDADGNEVKPESTVHVYLPYPDGVNFNNAASFSFKLRHYTDSTYTNHSEITLTPTEHGLRFETVSFSPFLLGWKASSGGGSSSGYSVNMPSFAYPLQNTQVIAATGTGASMSVSVSGAEPLSYQWQINRGSGWGNIAGATGAAYYTNNVEAANDGYQYRCVASNAYGTATSRIFTLRVTDAIDVPKTGGKPGNVGWLVVGMCFGAALPANKAQKRKHQR